MVDKPGEIRVCFLVFLRTTIHIALHAAHHGTSKQPPEESDGWDKQIVFGIIEAFLIDQITRISQRSDCKNKPEVNKEFIELVHPMGYWIRSIETYHKV